MKYRFSMLFCGKAEDSTSEEEDDDELKPEFAQTQWMYHGTSKEAWYRIRKYGFKTSRYGRLGRGIYLTRDIDKAMTYMRGDDGILLYVRVKLGSCCSLNADDLKKNWHNEYDSAYAGPNVLGAFNKEEHCVLDPRRILQVVEIPVPVPLRNQ